MDFLSAVKDVVSILLAPKRSPSISKIFDFPECDDSPFEAFQYDSLGLASGAAKDFGTKDADIRLLEIFPHSAKSGRIRCAIHHYCVLLPVQRISYSALSYVWGAQERDRTLAVDGKVFEVTRNVETILRRLRRRDCSVYVWIDAICINQSFNPEKAKQISRMDTIYSTADEVIAYLGEDADNSELFLDFADVLLKKLLALEKTHKACNIEAEDLEKFGLPPARDPSWKALRAVFERPWFGRKWIVQECVLAKLITCVLGVSTFNFELLCMLHQLCLEHNLDQIYVDGSALTIPRVHPFTILSSIRDRVRAVSDDNADRGDMSLPWLLAATSYAKVSKDDRDHIYALMGVHETLGIELEPPFPNIDYDKSVRDVFIDFACKSEWTETSTEVSLLELAQQEKLLDLLSWVPDWTRPTPLEYAVHTLDPGDTTFYSASAGQDRRKFRFDRSTETLSVCAVVFDRITQLQPNLFDHDSPVEWTEQNTSMKRMGFDYLTKLSSPKCCVSSRGYKMLVHKSSQIDDSIIIISGERVPFVIRRAKQGWRLIGWAYLSSIMQGNGLDSNSPYYAGNTPQTLTLV